MILPLLCFSFLFLAPAFYASIYSIKLGPASTPTATAEPDSDKEQTERRHIVATDSSGLAHSPPRQSPMAAQRVRKAGQAERDAANEKETRHRRAQGRSAFEGPARRRCTQGPQPHRASVV
eukprot:scaffold7684_cov119-Isochrysis_galbana.AAC.7